MKGSNQRACQFLAYSCINRVCGKVAFCDRETAYELLVSSGEKEEPYRRHLHDSNLALSHHMGEGDILTLFLLKKKKKVDEHRTSLS